MTHAVEMNYNKVESFGRKVRTRALQEMTHDLEVNLTQALDMNSGKIASVGNEVTDRRSSRLASFGG